MQGFDYLLSDIVVEFIIKTTLCLDSDIFKDTDTFLIVYIKVYNNLKRLHLFTYSIYIFMSETE